MKLEEMGLLFLSLPCRKTPELSTGLVTILQGKGPSKTSIFDDDGDLFGADDDRDIFSTPTTKITPEPEVQYLVN